MILTQEMVDWTHMSKGRVSAVKLDGLIAILLLSGDLLFIVFASDETFRLYLAIVGSILGCCAGWPVGALDGWQILDNLEHMGVSKRTWRHPFPLAGYSVIAGLLLTFLFSLAGLGHLAVAAFCFLVAYVGSTHLSRAVKMLTYQLRVGLAAEVAWSGDSLVWPGLLGVTRLYRRGNIKR